METLRSSLAVEVKLSEAKGRQLLIPVSRGLPPPTWASSPTLWATAPAPIPEAMLGVLPGEDLSSWLGTSTVLAIMCLLEPRALGHRHRKPRPLRSPGLDLPSHHPV